MNDAHALLLDTGQVAGDVDDADDRQTVGVADLRESGGLLRGVDVETAGQVHRLVRDDTYRAPVDARERGNDVGREVRGELEHVAVVEHAEQHVVHVVGGVVGVRDDRVERHIGLGALGLDPRVDARRLLVRGRRQELQQLARPLEGGGLVLGDVGDVARVGLRHRVAELLDGDVLAGHGLDDVGAGDEHVRLFAVGDDEVRAHRRVHGAAGALAEHHRNLRNHARGLVLPLADLRVIRERGDRVLHARAARVVDTDDRGAGLDAELHDRAHLAAEALAERTAEHGDVVREDDHGAAVDRAAPRHHAVGGRVRGVTGRLDHEPDLDERTRVEQRVDAVARGGLTRGVAARLRALAARVHGDAGALAQVRKLLGGGSRCRHLRFLLN